MSEGQFNALLRTTSQIALLMLGFFAVILALQTAHAILAPIALAIVLGLVFGPVADRLEARGIPPALSAAMVLLALICVIATAILLLSVPLSEWIGRAPAIWSKMQSELRNWQGPLQSLASLQDQFKSVLGNSGALEVTVQDGNQVVDVALLVPQIAGDILIFLVSLYFYLATRENIRVSILSLCVTRRMRWRTAHIFSDVETKVSRYLLSVTFLNVCVGIAMTIITWGLGLPSPLLWGVCAGVLNYIPYVGQAAMICILLAVGFATQPDLPHILAPVGCYLVVNLIEGQLVFPQFVGHQMTINPFLIFLSIIFWIWIWGPFGSLFAVPMLLVLQSAASNILPTMEVKPRRPVRRTAQMTEKDVVLANAARVIKEKAQDEAAAAAAEEAAKAEADLAKAQAERAEKEKEAAAAAKPARRRRAAKPGGEKPAVAT
jgi:predicted PurR-regulated permease PerM